jgi:glycosyltransferase involved in cell wall biosynthesis
VESAGVATVQATHAVMGTWKNKIDLYIAPTEFVREKLIQGGYAPDAIAVRPHFVLKTQSTSPPPYANRIRNRPLIVFVGRLSAEKGITTLLEAWKLVTIPDAELVVIGSGPLSQSVVSAALNDERIVGKGRLSPQDVRRYLEMATLVVVPSDCYESFGKVVIEAFAVGTPVIVSGHGSLAAIVRHGREGIHFRPGDAYDLAHQITALFYDKPMARRLSYGAVRRFHDQFTAEHIYSATIELYERAISMSRSHQIDSRVA